MPVRNDRVARFLELIEGERAASTLGEILQSMCEGESFEVVCERLEVPSGRVMMWLMDDEERYRKYKVAHGVYWDLKAQRTVEIAGAGPVVGEDVGRDKLRISTTLKLAESHAPEIYRRAQKVDVTVNVDLGERLRRAQERAANPAAANPAAARVVEGEAVEVKETKGGVWI